MDVDPRGTFTPSTMGTPAHLSGWGQNSLKAVPPPGGANEGGGIGRGCTQYAASFSPTMAASPAEGGFFANIHLKTIENVSKSIHNAFRVRDGYRKPKFSPAALLNF